MIPYLKSYALENVDQHLSAISSYSDYKLFLLATLSSDKALSSHDALYDCVVGLACFKWWTQQYSEFLSEFPYLGELIEQTDA